ncbi:translocation protein SEC62-like isoform X2 [Ceratina calcarata]|uniref:Translocation protein SEC62 n=2 Tax=Ceratina calcarata TaxID=156304 RepID=A0AAJ7JFY2_9HYME|nr:translocation protein SEC62-like isoform X2 [Ceratina calcarata]
MTELDSIEQAQNGIYNMAERKKSRKRKDETSNVDNEVIHDKPSKEEYAVAKWIHNNVPSKKTKFDRIHNVEYFTGSRAVAALLENSPWSKTRFETREQVTEFLDLMLRHKFFHRAKKVVIPEEELCKIRGIKKKVKETKKDKKNKEESKEIRDGGKDSDDKCEEKKKKPKVRLEMHMEQYFVDCNDAYVWIYEPIPIYYWFFGTLVVLGAIGVCLFPLWPLTIRHGVYYISVAAAGFLIFILALAIIRLIVFCLLWVPTLGRCHLWLFPNLTADVGFFASFWPLYQYEYYGSTSENDKKVRKKKKKEKDSDTEETQVDEKPSSRELDKDHTEDASSSEEKLSSPELMEGEEGSEGSESEKSNTGKDFVMV